jgi:hypothetical protein
MDKSLPSVSVVIPALNAADTIGTALGSVADVALSTLVPTLPVPAAQQWDPHCPTRATASIPRSLISIC